VLIKYELVAFKKNLPAIGQSVSFNPFNLWKQTCIIGFKIVRYNVDSYGDIIQEHHVL
jgi:hypothetical protein